MTAVRPITQVDSVESRVYTVPADAPEADGTYAWDSTTPNLRHLKWFHDHVRIESMFFDGPRTPRAARSPLTRTRPATA